MTDETPRADALILYGITGDLATKMLLPSLYRMVADGFLDQPVIGVTHGDWTRERLHEHAREAVSAACDGLDEEVFGRFTGLLRLVAVDFEDQDSFQALADEVDGLGFLVHYAALPPHLYGTLAERLAGAGLAENARLVVEKPFGHDLASARELQKELTEYFPEERLLRVDHFLGKEVVEDLLALRFANTVLATVLTRDAVRSVQVTMFESFDVADRGSFYDEVGALRDVVQNHLLQTLLYLVMEVPRTRDAAGMLDEKARTLKAIRTVSPDDYVRGQYEGYLGTEGVADGSTTETYCALKVDVATDRWRGVPFTLRAGKAMAVSAIEIVVELALPPTSPYYREGASSDLVRFRLSPNPGVTLTLQAERAGGGGLVTDMPARSDFTELDSDDVAAYVNVLKDAITGDPRRFVRMDIVEESWRILDDIVGSTRPPVVYERGSWGPKEADQLVTDQRWLPLET